MANVNLRVVGHFADANSNTLKHYGTGIQFLVSIPAPSGDSLTGTMPSAAAISTALSNNGKIPSGATFVVDGFANLDKAQFAAGILS